jgi:hypothetical protein
MYSDDRIASFLIVGSIIVDSLGVCCDAGCRKFDKARKSNGGKYTDEFVSGVIAVLRVLPVFILIIMYWAIYSQVSFSLYKPHIYIINMNFRGGSAVELLPRDLEVVSSSPVQTGGLNLRF